MEIKPSRSMPSATIKRRSSLFEINAIRRGPLSCSLDMKVSLVEDKALLDSGLSLRRKQDAFLRESQSRALVKKTSNRRVKQVWDRGAVRAPSPSTVSSLAWQRTPSREEGRMSSRLDSLQLSRSRNTRSRRETKSETINLKIERTGNDGYTDERMGERESDLKNNDLRQRLLSLLAPKVPGEDLVFSEDELAVVISWYEDVSASPPLRLAAARVLCQLSFPEERVYGLRRVILSTDGVEYLLEQAIHGQLCTYNPLNLATDGIELGAKIGQGASGAVYKAEFNGDRIVIKYFSVDWICYDEKEFLAEATIMTILQHDNLMHCLGAGKTIDGSSFIALPEYDCSLQEYVEQNLPLSGTLALKIAVDVCRGIALLHRCGLIHRDIKPANVLMRYPKGSSWVSNTFAKWEVVLCDFGCVRSEYRHTQQKKRMTLNIGTTYYMAPELSNEDAASYDTSVDTFAFGMLLYFLFCKERPFAGLHSIEVLEKVSAGERPSLPDTLSPALADIIQWCWKQNPHERPSMESVYVCLITLFRTTCEALSCESEDVERWIAVADEEEAGELQAGESMAKEIADRLDNPFYTQWNELFMGMFPFNAHGESTGLSGYRLCTLDRKLETPVERFQSPSEWKCPPLSLRSAMKCLLPEDAAVGSMREILDCGRLARAFSAYLKTMFCEENLQFILAVACFDSFCEGKNCDVSLLRPTLFLDTVTHREYAQEGQPPSQEAIDHAAQALFDCFLLPDSEVEVCVEYSLREQLEQKLKDGVAGRGMFSRTMVEVLNPLLGHVSSFREVVRTHLRERDKEPFRFLCVAGRYRSNPDGQLNDD